MSWKLSVVEDVSFFLRGSQYDNTLSAAVAVGASTASLHGESLPSYAGQGDIVKLGPSTNTANLGATDQVRIISTSPLTPTVFTFSPVTTYAYAHGDSVSCCGSRLSDGWSHDSTIDGAGNYHKGDILSVGGIKVGSTGNCLAGYMHSTSGQFWTINAQVTGSTNQLTRNLNRPLLSGVVYRLGGYFLQTGFTGTGFTLGLSGATSRGTVTLQSNYATWTNREVLCTAWPYNDYTSASIIVKNVTTAENGYIGMDLVYLTHASMSNGQAAGVYSFTKDPSAISDVEVSREITSKLSSDFDLFGHSLLSLSPRGYSLVFDTADETMVNQLERFQYWQGLGYPLMLESDITGMKPTIGFMDFDIRYESWDPNILTVNLVFKGV
jgi:hypothetical protein